MPALHDVVRSVAGDWVLQETPGAPIGRIGEGHLDELARIASDFGRAKLSSPAESPVDLALPGWLVQRKRGATPARLSASDIEGIVLEAWGRLVVTHDEAGV